VNIGAHEAIIYQVFIDQRMYARENKSDVGTWSYGLPTRLDLWVDIIAEGANV
jgi:hypothetical protein